MTIGAHGERVEPRGAFLLLLPVILLLAGCVLFAQETDPFDGATTPDMVSVEVRNDYEGDATIYAMWNGDRHRVGFVAAGETTQFQVRWRSSELGFQVELQGGRTFATSPTLISPRGSIHVRIPDQLP